MKSQNLAASKPGHRLKKNLSFFYFSSLEHLFYRDSLELIQGTKVSICDRYEMIHNRYQSVTLSYLWRLSPRLCTHRFLEAKGLEIHYPSSYGFSGITVDEISEWHRKEENEDLAAHPAASRPAGQLSTRSFGRQQSSEGRSAVGGVMASGAIIENLIKMLKKLSGSSEQRWPPRRPAPNPMWSCGNAKRVWQQQ